MLCHLSETLSPFFFRLLLVLCDSAPRSIVRETDFLLEMCFFCEPRHTVFQLPGWRWVPTLSSNPISHLPSGGAEGLNFVVRGKAHIHILSRLSVKLSPTAHTCFPFCLVSHPWEHCPMPQAPCPSQRSWTSCRLGPEPETKEPKWVHLGRPTGLGTGRNPWWSSV